MQSLHGVADHHLTPVAVITSLPHSLRDMLCRIGSYHATRTVCVECIRREDVTPEEIFTLLEVGRERGGGTGGGRPIASLCVWSHDVGGGSRSPALTYLMALFVLPLLFAHCCSPAVFPRRQESPGAPLKE